MLALSSSCPRGPIVEVGTYQGGTAWDLAGRALDWGAELHLFDTFTGIPYKAEDDSIGVGTFSDTDVERVRAAVPLAHIYKGLFPETLPADLTGIGLAHIDCDQYQAVLACIDHLGPRMLPGGMMFFDDLMLAGCARAVRERNLPLRSSPGGRDYVVF